MTVETVYSMQKDGLVGPSFCTGCTNFSVSQKK